MRKVAFAIVLAVICLIILTITTGCGSREEYTYVCEDYSFTNYIQPMNASKVIIIYSEDGIISVNGNQEETDREQLSLEEDYHNGIDFYLDIVEIFCNDD